MDEIERHVPRVVYVALGVAVLLTGAVSTAFGLLHWWNMPAGGQTDSAALIAPIPEPRLQTAPQLDRVERLVWRVGGPGMSDAAGGYDAAGGSAVGGSGAAGVSSTTDVAGATPSGASAPSGRPESTP